MKLTIKFKRFGAGEDPILLVHPQERIQSHCWAETKLASNCSRDKPRT